MTSRNSFTEGPILKPLLKFAFPVLVALFLQSLYGAVDLLIVGQFAESSDVSAVSTGAQIMSTITNAVAGLAMGTTVLLGQQIGKGEKEEAGKTVGGSIVFFAILSILLTVVLVLCNTPITQVMNAPEEAFKATQQYILVCSLGMVFIVGYNLIGSLFRGLGNSRLPLLTVAIAAVMNIFGDLLLVNVFHLGALGAALATVASQAFSVALSFVFIRKLELPFHFKKDMIRFSSSVTKKVLNLGFPICLSDVLVGISFLVIVAIVNQLGVTASAGVGVAEKVCGFIMLVPSAFGQSMAAFVAQNYGAGKMDRAYKALRYGITTSFVIGVVIAIFSYFRGDLLCGIFSKDREVVLVGWEYLKAYAIDCLLTAFFFNLNGFFNGCGYTKFVMAQNLVGGIGVRLPVSYLMSCIKPVSIFRIGLATPSASFVQNIMCFFYMFFYVKKKEKQSVK